MFDGWLFSRAERCESDNTSDMNVCDNTSPESTNAMSAITSTESDGSSSSPINSGSGDTDQNNSTEAGLVSSALLPAMTLVQDDASDEDAEASLQQLHLDVSVEKIRTESSKDMAREVTTAGNSSDEYDDDSATDAARSCSHPAAPSQVTDDSSTPPPSNPTDDVCKPSEVPVQVSDSALAGKIHAPDRSRTESNNSTEYNNFQYWRMPIPEIDMTVDKSGNSKPDRVQSSDDVSSMAAEDNSTTDSHRGLSDLEAGSEQALIEDDQMEKGASDGCGPIYTASVQTVCETVEEVANFGSTHVVGQHVSEQATAMKGDAPGMFVLYMCVCVCVCV